MNTIAGIIGLALIVGMFIELWRDQKPKPEPKDGK